MYGGRGILESSRRWRQEVEKGKCLLSRRARGVGCLGAAGHRGATGSVLGDPSKEEPVATLPPPTHSHPAPPSHPSPSLPLSAERVLGQAVLVRPLQSHEPHAVHRLRRPGARQHVRPVDHHAEHDRGRHLLRHVRGPRHSAHPVAGLVASPVPREGESKTLK